MVVKGQRTKQCLLRTATPENITVWDVTKLLGRFFMGSLVLAILKTQNRFIYSRTRTVGFAIRRLLQMAHKWNTHQLVGLKRIQHNERNACLVSLINRTVPGVITDLPITLRGHLFYFLEGHSAGINLNGYCRFCGISIIIPGEQDSDL